MLHLRFSRSRLRRYCLADRQPSGRAVLLPRHAAVARRIFTAKLVSGHARLRCAATGRCVGNWGGRAGYRKHRVFAADATAAVQPGTTGQRRGGPSSVADTTPGPTLSSTVLNWPPDAGLPEVRRPPLRWRHHRKPRQPLTTIACATDARNWRCPGRGLPPPSGSWPAGQGSHCGQAAGEINVYAQHPTA